ncbi:alpha/beta hydrolase [Amycolatopsis acidicola]|uniref:Alpha/beta hydrolase n=1 Tax=Amycolatopsis acidicola TaxID=2596893 RepID=A0A5N0ULM6_9PSEU|nr:alpha/beta fold hydrolase [Amycolatopsis acidicola]KAA9150838.1 alpha/beta hydrolase [Amycolatopsis acidicola]
MSTFLLVPGAWLGGWVWADTVAALAQRGHDARPLTLTGLAERAGEATPETDLTTHIDDILRAAAGLHDLTLVAHSYAAAPVTTAAARLGDRLARVVYVDSAPFSEGMRMLDLMPPEAADALRAQLVDHRLPFDPLSGSTTGLGPREQELLRARATPQPFGTYEQRLPGPVEPGPGVDRVLVACEEFTTMLDAGVPALAALTRPPWRRFDLATGHWPMLSEPARLAEVLDRAVKST